MPNLPFTICTEDYAKDGIASEIILHECESAYPITNINNKNRLSYCKFQDGNTPAFEIDLGATKSVELILIELSRPYEIKDTSFNVNYWTGSAWEPLTGLAVYTQSGASKLPGQIKQYTAVEFFSGAFDDSFDDSFDIGGSIPVSAQKFRVYFTDRNSAAQVEIRRVIFCGVISRFNGENDFYGPEEQNHSNIGKIQVPLLHGNAFRGQSFGALKQSKQMRFSEINPDQLKLLEDLESDYQTFGILDWTGRYIECFITPAGLQVKDSGVDADNKPWFDVTMRVQEI